MNNRIRVRLSAAAALGAAAAVAGAQTFYSTGEGLADLARDVHWKVEKVQGGTPFSGVQSAWVMDHSIYPVVGAYRRQGYSRSKWITISESGICANNDIFRFSTTFTLPSRQGHTGGPDATGWSLTGQFSSDNASEMYVNGQLVAALPWYGPLGYSFQAIQTFDATPYLVNGTNTVSFLVGAADTMGSNQGPVAEWMGLRVEGQLTAVPEPTSFAILALGLGAVLRRRR